MFRGHGLNTYPDSLGLLQDGDICNVVVLFDVEDGVVLRWWHCSKLFRSFWYSVQASQPFSRLEIKTS